MAREHTSVHFSDGNTWFYFPVTTDIRFGSLTTDKGDSFLTLDIGVSKEELLDIISDSERGIDAN